MVSTDHDSIQHHILSRTYSSLYPHHPVLSVTALRAFAVRRPPPPTLAAYNQTLYISKQGDITRNITQRRSQNEYRGGTVSQSLALLAGFESNRLYHRRRRRAAVGYHHQRVQIRPPCPTGPSLAQAPLQGSRCGPPAVRISPRPRPRDHDSGAVGAPSGLPTSRGRAGSDAH